MNPSSTSASAQERIDRMFAGITASRPVLGELAVASSIQEYLDPLFAWNPSATVFPNRTVLEQIIFSEISRLYTHEIAMTAREQLQHLWTVESGSHVAIPRDHDRPNAPERRFHMNAMIFQGQVIWESMNAAHGNSIALSVSSGRVPPNNVNSGAYLELPGMEKPMRMVSDKYRESPQTLIPPVVGDALQAKRGQLQSVKRQLSEYAFDIASRVLTNFERHAEAFSDQVVTTHAIMMNAMIPDNLVQQVTVDSEVVGRQFLVSLLRDPSSAFYTIFADASLRAQFIQEFVGISTGWSADQTPFYQVERKGDRAKLQEYGGLLEPTVLADGLERADLMPKGALKFCAFMLEAGLNPIGGMNQSTYCKQIRDHAVAFMREHLSDTTRADILAHMPVSRAVVTPCWGIIRRTTNADLSGPITTLFDAPLTQDEFRRIIQTNGRESIVVGSPTLYHFLTDQEPPVSYEEIIPFVPNAIIK